MSKIRQADTKIRQTDRHNDRQIDRHKETDGQTERHRVRQTDTLLSENKILEMIILT